MIRLSKRDLCAFVYERAGLRHARACDIDVSGNQQGPPPLARLGESAGDQQLIESDFRHGQAERVRLQAAISASRPVTPVRASAACARDTASAASRLDSATP